MRSDYIQFFSLRGVFAPVIILLLSFLCPVNSYAVKGQKTELHNDDPNHIVNSILSNSENQFQNNYFKLREGLNNSKIVFTRQKKGRVVFLGGSITTMTWPKMVSEHLKKRFPQTDFEFINAGIPSMGSTPGAFRLTSDVFKEGRVDLLIQEAAVNDSLNGRTDDEQIRAMEGIVRHARSINPYIDIVFLYFADPQKIASYNKGDVPAVIGNHEKVAGYYSVPSINLALEVTDRINHKEFTWEDDFKDLHPSEFGQKIYAEAISKSLDNAWSSCIADDNKIEVQKSKLKVDEFCYDQAHLVDIKNATELKGFRHISKWRNADDCATRPGFVDVPMLVGENPGDSFTLKFNGSAVGLFVAAGMDAGIIEYRVDDFDWQRLDMFTQWSGWLHIPWMYILDAQLANQSHILEVRICKEKNPPSQGHACRIAYFGVNSKP